MTNLNQMREVLLFVCSKMADETQFSSKLPVADRSREVSGRKLLVMHVLLLSTEYVSPRFC